MWNCSPEVAQKLKEMGGKRTVSPRPCGKLNRAWKNPKFKNWVAGLIVCFSIAFIEPFAYAMENAATSEMWLNVFFTGEILFIAVSSLITALNDSVHSIKDSPAIEIATLVIGAVLYAIIKGTALRSDSVNTTLAIVVTLAIWVVVLTRCIGLYLVNGEDGK